MLGKHHIIYNNYFKLPQYSYFCMRACTQPVTSKFSATFWLSSTTVAI